MMMKLNMTDTKANFPSKYKDRTCPMCKAEDETTEHLFQCEKYKELARHTLEWDGSGNQWKDINWMRQSVKVIERIK